MTARNNLALRIVSALVLGTIAIWGVVWSNFIFNCVLIVSAYLAGQEWSTMVERRVSLPGVTSRLSSSRRAASLLPAALLILWLLAANTKPDVYLVELVGMTFLLVPVLFYPRLSESRLLIWGVPYIGATVLSLMALHRAQNWHALIFLLMIVWATDICAYGVGRAVGGPKLAPAISPGKTWAGSVGGLAGAALVAALISHWLGGRSIPHSIAVGCGISLLTQIGDLFESALKRRFAVKDSGFLIPGHGGILDRIDGLLLAAPVFTLYRLWLGGPL